MRQAKRARALECDVTSRRLLRAVGNDGMRSGGYIQVITTTASKEDARRIADRLIAARLAACVQIVGPISSIYRWQGNIERASERLCVIKTRLSLYAQVEALIRTLHPYDVPEILAVPVLAGNRDYLRWLNQELAGPKRQTRRR